MTLARTIIQMVFQVVTLVIFIDVILSFFLSPYHKVRMVLDKIVEPMLNPIRRIIPRIGNLDFSPIVLLLLLQFLESLILRVI